jgi:hypothetical protein
MGGISSETLVPWRTFSGFNKARLGWVSMKTITKDQNVTIAPINKPSTLTHAARILIGGTKEWPEYLYFDYKILPHNNIDGSKTLATSGLSVRRADDLGKENAISAFAPETELYDMHPKSSSLSDARLTKNMQFTAKEGVSIKVLSANSEYLRFAIRGINSIKPLKKTEYSMK